MAPLEPSICWEAIYTRDPRFDGRFFAAATTTGLYCRNVCPVPFAQGREMLFCSTAPQRRKRQAFVHANGASPKRRQARRRQLALLLWYRARCV